MTLRPSSERAFRADVVIPFTLITLIWGSTWLVIHDQISVVPPSWSVAYRFLLAAIAMFGLARFRKLPLAIGIKGLGFAFVLGLLQFALNFNLVYQAEIHVTSGLVAVLYALLIVPNSLLARLLFKQSVTREFLIGSIVAAAGVAMLFLHEARVSDVGSAGVLTGIVLSLLGVLSASMANVLQIAEIARRLPMMSVLAWAMLMGGLLDAGFALATAGLPVIDPRPGYIAGIAYLAIVGSVITFPLYFGLIQRIGAGRAAYTSVLIPVLAMLLSTLFENYMWSPLAICGAGLSLVGMIIAMRARQAPSLESAASPSRNVG